jgi:hypothetical protein
LDILNPESGFYNNICYLYTSENGTDVPLSRRKKDFIEKGLSLCEENCNFIDYDGTSVTCSCQVKINFESKIDQNVIDEEKLLKCFTDFNNIANIKVFKCYKLFLDLNSLTKNYANIIFIAILFLYLISIVIFICKDFKEIKKLVEFIKYFKLNSELIFKFKNKKKKLKTNKSDKINNKKNLNIEQQINKTASNIRIAQPNFLEIQQHKEKIFENLIPNPTGKKQKKIKK